MSTDMLGLAMTDVTTIDGESGLVVDRLGEMSLAVLKPELRTIDLAEVRGPLADIIEQAARDGERLIVEKNGAPLAEVVPTSTLSERASRMEELFAEMSRIGEAFADVPLDDLERDVEREVDAVRAERGRSASNVQRG